MGDRRQGTLPRGRARYLLYGRRDPKPAADAAKALMISSRSRRRLGTARSSHLLGVDAGRATTQPRQSKVAKLRPSPLTAELPEATVRVTGPLWPWPARPARRLAQILRSHCVDADALSGRAESLREDVEIDRLALTGKQHGITRSLGAQRGDDRCPPKRGMT